MKWQRGLFRLWLILSVCWLVAVGASTWATLPEVPGWAKEEKGDIVQGSSSREFDPKEFEAFKTSAERTERIKYAAVLAFAPPLIVVVLGAAFAWAITGFRPS
jgi:hypothetical protein